MSKKKGLITQANESLKSFRRFESRSWVGGVCAGVSYRLSVPLWLVRLIWGLLLLCYGIGFLPYLALWVFVPDADTLPADYVERTGDG